MGFVGLAEVQALVAILLTIGILYSVVVHQLDPKELLLPFSTILGFLYGTQKRTIRQEDVKKDDPNL